MKRLTEMFTDAISFLRSRTSTEHRILRWELPRLLSAIERLDASVIRESAHVAVGGERGDDSPRLIEYRQSVLRRQLVEVTTSADRIRSLLGY